MKENKIRKFTSTGYKLIHHPEVIDRIKMGFGIPVSVQIAPTSRCNLNCVFCSNVNREKHEDLDIDDLMDFIHSMKVLGAKTVEITGGGDPTMYHSINTLLNYLFAKGFQVGLISNGIALRDNIEQKYLDQLSWLRISMNCLDYVKSVDIPKIKGILGFSYVWNEKTNQETLNNLEEHRIIYNPRYIRIVPNCQATDLEQELNNKLFSKLVPYLGPSYFYQPKTFNKPGNCWWGYFKPFLLHDGFVYPCSSVVLNDSAERKFHEKFRWCKMEELERKYFLALNSFPTDNCTHCVFSEQNQLISDIIYAGECKDFI